MIDLAPFRIFFAHRGQPVVVRREDVRIKTRVLDFAFPLITPDVVTGEERERDEAQQDGHAPENRSRTVRPVKIQWAKNEAAAKNAIPQSTAASTNRTGIVGITPVVETVQGSEEDDLGGRARARSAPA